MFMGKVSNCHGTLKIIPVIPGGDGDQARLSTLKMKPNKTEKLFKDVETNIKKWN